GRRVRLLRTGSRGLRGGREVPARAGLPVRERASMRRLAKFYGELSSLELVLGALAAGGGDREHPRARDLYARGLDCQNLGAFPMLELLASVSGEHGAPSPADELLDVGCGLGGPGRFLADRFGCSVVGTDLLAKRIEIAKALRA